MRQKLTKVDSENQRSAVRARQDAFLAALSAGPRGMHAITAAAQAAGVARTTPYRWRATDAAFAARWQAISDAQHAAFLAAYAEQRARRDLARRRRLAELRPIYQANAANATRARAAKRRARY